MTVDELNALKRYVEASVDYRLALELRNFRMTLGHPTPDVSLEWERLKRAEKSLDWHMLNNPDQTEES